MTYLFRLVQPIEPAHVEPDDFENPIVGTIAEAVRTLVDADKPIGPRMVCDELRRTGT